MHSVARILCTVRRCRPDYACPEERRVGLRFSWHRLQPVRLCLRGGPAYPRPPLLRCCRARPVACTEARSVGPRRASAPRSLVPLAPHRRLIAAQNLTSYPCNQTNLASKLRQPARHTQPPRARRFGHRKLEHAIMDCRLRLRWINLQRQLQRPANLVR